MSYHYNYIILDESTSNYLLCSQFKCGKHEAEIWPWMINEIRPTLDELGISTPDEMGYDKPELACQNVYDIH